MKIICTFIWRTANILFDRKTKEKNTVLGRFLSIEKRGEERKERQRGQPACKLERKKENVQIKQNNKQ